MSIHLRQYQLDIINDIRNHFRQGHKSVLVQLPTGAGKTLLSAEMIRLSVERGSRVWFVCNRIELIDQTANAFQKMNLNFSFIANGYEYNPNANIHICSIQTLKNRIHLVNKPTLIFWDESHQIAAKTWASVYHENSTAYHVLLTATPCRLDGQGFKQFATALVQGPTVSQLIDIGFLCKYRAYAPQQPDLSGVHKRMGEFVKSEISELVDQPKFTGNAVNEYIKHANGKRNLVFCVNIEHSKHVKEQFEYAGISSCHIDGETPKHERTEIINKFKRGEILTLTSVDLVTTGFDVPAIECVTFLRPTASVSLAIQMMGRGLRPSENKSEVIFLDHVNLFRTHGLPDSEREWSLDGIKKREKESVQPVKTCSVCFAAIQSFHKICPYCNYEFPISESLDLTKTQTKEELAEIKLAELIQKKQERKKQGQAQTYDELVMLGKQRGYKNPHAWAHYIYSSRKNRHGKKNN